LIQIQREIQKEPFRLFLENKKEEKTKMGDDNKCPNCGNSPCTCGDK